MLMYPSDGTFSSTIVQGLTVAAPRQRAAARRRVISSSRSAENLVSGQTSLRTSRSNATIAPAAAVAEKPRVVACPVSDKFAFIFIL